MQFTKKIPEFCHGLKNEQIKIELSFGGWSKSEKILRIGLLQKIKNIR